MSPPVSDEERLFAQLRKLAGPPESRARAGRRLEISAPGGALRAVLREIDETVLPRELDFVTDRGRRFRLEVANRRLFRLREMAPPALAAAAEEVLERPLSAAEPALLEALGRALEAALADAESLFVAASRDSGSLPAGVAGCASETLAAVWGISLATPAPGIDSDLIDRFVESCAPMASGTVVIDRLGVAQKIGRAEALDELERLACAEPDFLRRRLDGCFPAARRPAYLSALDAGPGGETLFYGAGAGVQMFMSVPTERRAEILATWKRLAGSGFGNR